MIEYLREENKILRDELSKSTGKEECHVKVNTINYYAGDIGVGFMFLCSELREEADFKDSTAE